MGNEIILERFLEYLQYERNRSQLTVENYRRDLCAFEAYLEAQDEYISWDTVDSDLIRNWLEWMMDKGNTATSVNRRLSAVRSFYHFALSRGLVPHDPSLTIRGPKKVKPLPQFLKEREMDSLLEQSHWDMEDYKDRCIRTIIQTFYETGVRLSELIGLDKSSIDLITNEVKVRGKGNKQRIIPFGDGMHKALEEYAAMRDNEIENSAANPAFFQTQKGKRFRPEHLRNIVKERLSTVCALKKRSPHVLRHTFATAMLNHKAGIESVSKLLGHRNLAATEIYTHTTFEQLKKVYASSHPRTQIINNNLK